MSKIKSFFGDIANKLKITINRFPMTLIFLAFMTAVMFILIEDYSIFDDNTLSRLMFSGIFGTFLSTAIKFKLERFEKLSKYTFLFYGLSILLAVGYYFYMTDNKISSAMFIHLLVISFALFAAYLYVPSAKNTLNFGNVALAHFKAAFTSILYGVVLYLGIAAIISAVDILLYEIDYKSYAHSANLIFVFFTPLYYLSLLPKFNSNDDEKKEISYIYPKFLDILVSYITIPLITAFSAVLIIYFIKILVTGVWPVGQVGPMVLGYSAAGYFIYILGSNLDNKFTVYYRKLFPMVLLPLVVMQLVSSYIRIDAYGITESRYYVVLFGIFSIVCALILIFNKKKNPNIIVLLSAIFAILSIIPPVDAFTVSKKSQQSRLEEILNRNNMLVNNEIIRKSDLSNDDKYEITNISNYMFRMGYLNDMTWYPKEGTENYYSDFANIYGFEQNYNRAYPEQTGKTYISVSAEGNEAINIEGFDILLNVSFSNKNSNKINKFNVKGKNYTLTQKFDEKGNITIIVSDDKGILIEVPMKEFIDGLFEKANEKTLMSQDNLTIEKQNDILKMKILINDINADRYDPYDPNNTYIYINAIVLIAGSVSN